MTHAWHQFINIHEKLARKLIESQQHLAVNTIRLLDEGWDNLVYLVNESLIFRFPRREFGVMCMENEIMLLPFIASQVEFPLSTPKWIGHPIASYPYPFSGHHMSFLPYTCERDKVQLRHWASMVLTRVMDEIWMLF